MSTPRAELNQSFYVTPGKIKNSPCVNVLIVTVLAIAVIMGVTGVFCVMASTGHLPPFLHSLSHLSQIGAVNGGLMIAGGVALFILGNVAWAIHQKQQLEEQHLPHE